MEAIESLSVLYGAPSARPWKFRYLLDVGIFGKSFGASESRLLRSVNFLLHFDVWTAQNGSELLKRNGVVGCVCHQMFDFLLYRIMVAVGYGATPK